MIQQFLALARKKRIIESNLIIYDNSFHLQQFTSRISLHLLLQLLMPLLIKSFHFNRVHFQPMLGRFNYVTSINIYIYPSRVFIVFGLCIISIIDCLMEAIFQRRLNSSVQLTSIRKNLEIYYSVMTLKDVQYKLHSSYQH